MIPLSPILQTQSSGPERGFFHKRKFGAHGFLDSLVELEVFAKHTQRILSHLFACE